MPAIYAAQRNGKHQSSMYCALEIATVNKVPRRRTPCVTGWRGLKTIENIAKAEASRAHISALPKISHNIGRRSSANHRRNQYRKPYKPGSMYRRQRPSSIEGAIYATPGGKNNVNRQRCDTCGWRKGENSVLFAHD